MENKIQTIADFYGHKNQANKVIEELNELAVAIAHYERCCGQEQRDSLIEELADVEIMLSQIKHLYHIEYEPVHKVKMDKIERQIKRMKL